uniref:Uncharacterized protein n=1 Tax=Spongospora subterranea TaxID=70186 RepID=A0A0H5QYC5_9EUKA|eukprot:CRZ06656.1 hypothetical protein [Spongospora subterranea]
MGLGPFLFLLLCRFWALAHFSTIWTCWKWFKTLASFCFWEFVYTFNVYPCIPHAYDVQNLCFSFKLRIFAFLNLYIHVLHLYTVFSAAYQRIQQVYQCLNAISQPDFWLSRTYFSISSSLYRLQPVHRLFLDSIERSIVPVRPNQRNAKRGSGVQMDSNGFHIQQRKEK